MSKFACQPDPPPLGLDTVSLARARIARREQELLESNNALVDRARAAEQRVRDLEQENAALRDALVNKVIKAADRPRTRAELSPEVREMLSEVNPAS